jgi:hypothetical protein
MKAIDEFSRQIGLPHDELYLCKLEEDVSVPKYPEILG